MLLFSLSGLLRTSATCNAEVISCLVELFSLTLDFYLVESSYLNCLCFSTISHINVWDQVNSWKNLWKFWNGPLCRNKSGPFPLLNIAAYLQNSNAEAFAKKLSQILTNSIDNRGKGDWSHNLCDLLSKKLMKNERGFGKPRHFFV